MSNHIWRKYYYPQNGGGGGGGGGSPVYTAAQFIARAELAFQQITCYCSGGWGQPLNAANKVRMINKNSFNYTYRNIINAQPSNSFAFDCICLIKGILWGWNADVNDPNGGAVYGSNGVPDIGENTMITRCTDVSTDFSTIVPGEMLWMDGHAGIYIGGGLGIECTTGFGAWGVIKTAVGNIGPVSGYPTRMWTKHGKLPYISYP